MSSGRTDGKPQ
jgi:hypothetical protein